MNLVKNSLLCALFLASACISNLVYGEDWAQQVRLKNEQGQYLMVRDSQAVFVTDKNQASVFVAEEAANPQGLIGSIHRAFSYHGKYLYYDLTLRTEQPTEIDYQWLAPVHYLYYNNYKSGPDGQKTTLIAEDVPQ